MKREQDGKPWDPARRTGWVLTAILLVSTPFVCIADEVPTKQGSGQFEAEVLVQETALVVDFADTVSPRKLKKLRPKDVIVLEDGMRRRVTRIEPIASEAIPTAVPVFEGVTACPWTLVIYVDAVLADPATVVEGALALAQQADSLTELGCVDIVNAEPTPEVVVAGSRSPEYIEKILVDLATAARGEENQHRVKLSGPRGVDSREVSEVLVIESQWDRLRIFLADHRAVGPKALFLISDGFMLPEATMRILSGRQSLQGDSQEGDSRVGRLLADVVSATAQTLASYGWLTIAMPHVPGKGKPLELPEDEFDRMRDVAAGRIRAGERRHVINFLGMTRASELDDRLYEAYVLPTLAPLRALAEATSGKVIWSQRQIRDTLKELSQRRLVWYQTPERHDGGIRRLQARLADTTANLKAPWWKRSSTPDLVAESRLRRLLNDELPGSTLHVKVQLESSASVKNETATESLLRIEVSPIDLGQRVSIGQVRISIGFVHSAGIRSFQHRIDYEAPPLGGAWQYSISIQIPGGIERLAVGVEDLSLEEWGATIIDLENNE